MKESELLEASKEKLSEDFPEYWAVCAAFFLKDNVGCLQNVGLLILMNF